MGKIKQQHRPKLKKLKQKTHDKSKMKQIYEKLAQYKLKNQGLTSKLIPITEMHRLHKQQSKKQKKLAQCNLSDENDEQPQNQQPQQQNNPKMNIFALDSYQSQFPITYTNTLLQKTLIQQQLSHQTNLQIKTRKVLGQSLNLQKFGDKPLKIIQQSKQPLAMSEDQDQPNSLKTITHSNLIIPQGYQIIKRKKQIQQFRSKLPIYMKQQQIIQTINTHLVTLICGQTGSGKSTQLPQFLSQKHYNKLGKIGITQPRRLATMSLAKRVAQQMNYRIGQQIAYQVRHQCKQSNQSYIKFMTDGILLKQMSSDSLLLDYSVIIIDQAHERKLNTDILIGLLSRLILVRYKLSQQHKCNPLRLVIMSATLRISDFQNPKLFSFPVPLIKIQQKMYPVTIFHQKHTPQHYLTSAINKCLKIHKQLPTGDILIFLTGKQQIHQMAIQLEIQLNKSLCQQQQNLSLQFKDDSQIKVQGQYIKEQQPVRKNSNNSIKNVSPTNFIIYKLYSSLPIQKQDKIFQQTPPNTRKFIISTNIAQTSITVPNIRYVVDSGQQKHRYFDGVWRWKKGWGSKAMAAQRSGRAGRTTHGYCYRLYSSALYANIMEQYPQPEICKLPLQSVVLQIKAIGFTNIFAFPFPTPPSNISLKQSLQNLIQAGALQGQITLHPHHKPTSQHLSPNTMNPNQPQHQQSLVQINQNCKITQLGKIISFIPLSPKLSKMLLLGRQFNVEKYVLIISVLLTIQSIFKIKYTNNIPQQNYQLPTKTHSQLKNLNKSQFSKKYINYIDKQSGSDLFISMNITGNFLQQLYKSHSNQINHHTQQKQLYQHTISIHQIIKNWSNIFDLNQHVMRQFYYNCDQICQIYQTLTSSKIDLSTYQKPTLSQYRTLLQILLSTYSTNTCRIVQKNIYQTKTNEKVYIDQMSLLYKQHNTFISCIQFYLNEQTNNKYMRYPFKIINYQLLSTFGQIKQPKQYTWNNNNIVGITSGYIYGWEIPNLIINNVHNQGKYYAFAKLLLNGTIIKGFNIFISKNWIKYPINTIRPDNLQEHVQKLVMLFRSKDITSKNKLIQNTIKDTHFLQKQLKPWLNVKNYQHVYQTIRKMIIQSQKQ